MSLFDFHYQFVKYGEFHSNRINQLIHMIFVPVLICTAQVWLCSTPIIMTWSYSHILPINYAFIATMGYALYYFTLHQRLGLLITPFLGVLLYTANQVQGMTGLPYGLSANQTAVVVHIISWIFQILGHKVFEGRAPALTKDPIQAAVLGLFFVYCEFLFGFGLFKDLAESLKVDIDKKAAEYRAELKKNQ